MVLKENLVVFLECRTDIILGSIDAVSQSTFSTVLSTAPRMLLNNGIAERSTVAESTMSRHSVGSVLVHY